MTPAASVTKSVQAQATARRDAAIRDTGLVLAAIVIALVVVLVVARALVRPLRVLRDGALKVAHTDLEDEIAQVRAGGGEPVPQPLAVYTTEEIGQVAHAVDELHTQALLLAGDEARLRLLVNDMFETMSRRSRSLVDQQLSLIDRLERNEEDPDRLDSLFRLDHLAARLRRNSANLLVLAGAQLSRDQREPVPLSTVINAAVSEVEDYRRVADRPRCPTRTVIGAAVGSVIHLLAELIDNALRYSPPTTPVWFPRPVAATAGCCCGIVRLRSGHERRRPAHGQHAAAGRRRGHPRQRPPHGSFRGRPVGRPARASGSGCAARRPTKRGPGTTAEMYLPPTVSSRASAAGRRTAAAP